MRISVLRFLVSSERINKLFVNYRESAHVYNFMEDHEKI